EAFFRSRHDTLDARRAAARWRDERTLDVFYAELARRLDSAYAEPLSGARLEQVRTRLFGWAHDQFRGPVGQSLETYDWRWFAQAPLNSAVIIAERLYRMDLNLFDEIYLQNNADIAETIRAIQIRGFTQAGDPYQALYSRPGLTVEESAVKLQLRRPSRANDNGGRRGGRLGNAAVGARTLQPGRSGPPNG